MIAFSAFGVAQSVAEEPPGFTKFGDFYDPRAPASFYTVMEDGEEPKHIRSINQSILIIAWSPGSGVPPVEGSKAFQISGVDGYHSKAHVIRFLSAFFSQEFPRNFSANVVLAGNYWGAANELSLQRLSKEKSFSVYYAGGWAFQKAHLIKEPEDRLAIIQKAHKIALEAEGEKDAPKAER